MSDIIDLKIDRIKNKIEIYWNDIPFANIPFASYAGFQSWLEHDRPIVPYWIEIYTKDRDYLFAFDKRDNWTHVLSLLNDLSINS